MMRVWLLGLLLGVLLTMAWGLLLWGVQVWRMRRRARRWVYEDGDSRRVRDGWPELMVSSYEVWPRPQGHVVGPVFEEWRN